MGALLTKVSPIKDNDSGVGMSTMSDESTPHKFLDPRSPNPFRTPISELAFNDAKPVFRAQNLTTDDNISTSTTVTPTKLKNKLLHDLGYSKWDPRSPALNFDRTPIVFNDSNISEDFSLAGLSLNESNVQTPAKGDRKEIFYSPVPENVKFAECQIDPRSPSIDIERTPLTLNTLVDEPLEDDKNSQQPLDVEVVESITPTKENIDVDTVTTGTVKNMIYMDENQEQPMTPNIKSDVTEKSEKNVRTPLSCLMNSTDNRNDKRLKMQSSHNNKTILARKIFKESSANTNKMTNSSSKIPVLRKSLSKEIN